VDSLAAVTATGGIVTSYSACDASPLGGISYYRIKLVFDNGATQYSEVRSISFAEPENSFHLHLNPADKYTTLKINSSAPANATIDLFDNNGRLLSRKMLTSSQGKTLSG